MVKPGLTTVFLAILAERGVLSYSYAAKMDEYLSQLPAIPDTFDGVVADVKAAYDHAKRTADNPSFFEQL